MGSDVDEEVERAPLAFDSRNPAPRDTARDAVPPDGVDFEIDIGPAGDDGSCPVAYRFASDADAEAYLRRVREEAIAAVVRVALAGARIEPSSPLLPPKNEAYARVSRRGRTRPANVAHADYYDQYSSPLKKARFLKLAREGAFPCKRDGILRLVLRTDFEAYLASRAVHLVPRGRPEPPDETDDILARVGLRRVKP